MQCFDLHHRPCNILDLCTCFFIFSGGFLRMKCCLCGGDAGKYGNNARPLKDGQCCDNCNATKVIPARLRNDGIVLKAKHIEVTGVAGVTKDRWECPYCREEKRSECRFNLSTKKRGSIWKCRFCGNDLLLNKEDQKC